VLSSGIERFDLVLFCRWNNTFFYIILKTPSLRGYFYLIRIGKSVFLPADICYTMATLGCHAALVQLPT